MIKGVSMFSCGGIGEYYLKEAGIEIVLANELLPRRAKFYKHIHPDHKMVVGDITNPKVKETYIANIPEDVRFMIATPPCQGISVAGANKTLKDKLKDPRNYLFYHVTDVMKAHDFDYILFENVPGFLTLKYPYRDDFYTVPDILHDMFGRDYIIEAEKLDTQYFGVPQSRMRAVIKMYKKGKTWYWPQVQDIITLEKAIGDLPSLESGQDSGIKYHNIRTYEPQQILCMRHTATGCSAHHNHVYYPKDPNGVRIKGFEANYSRMKWDRPSYTITTKNNTMGSPNACHPGRKLPDGTYSDARTLSLLELLRVTSLPDDIDIPHDASYAFMCQLIGESVPPRFVYNIVKGIGELND